MGVYVADEKKRWEEFNLIIDSLDLDIKEKGLLLVIFRYVNYKTGYADPSRTLIKKLTGISDNRTLDKLFDSLIDKGYLIRKSGKGKRSNYFIKVGGNITPSVINEPSGEITPTVGGNITPILGGEITPQKENKRKIKENIYSLIFDYWISKNIKKHRNITNDMKKVIDKTLKEYSQDQILESINNYSVMFNDQNYQWCNYQWSLNEFLLRKDKDGIRQLGLFLNDGSKYINYLKAKELKNKQANDNNKYID